MRWLYSKTAVTLFHTWKKQSGNSDNGSQCRVFIANANMETVIIYGIALRDLIILKIIDNNY